MRYNCIDVLRHDSRSGIQTRAKMCHNVTSLGIVRVTITATVTVTVAVKVTVFGPRRADLADPRQLPSASQAAALSL